MTATPDIHPDQVDDVDEQQPTVEPSKPTPGKPAEPKPKQQATHTNVPAPLAGPKRRAALALGLPGAGLAEMLTHANFGWPGVLIGTGTALAGAGVAYVVRKRRQEREQDKSKPSRATAKPGGVARRVAGRLGLRSSGLASRAGAGAAGGPKRSAAGRVLSRVAGAGRGAGKAGGAAGGGKRAGRAGVRSALGSVGAGGRAAAAGKRAAGHRTPPGARTAAQAAGRRAAGLAGGAGRRSGGRGLPKVGGSSRRAGGSSTSSKGRSSAGRSAGRSGRGGGSGVSRLFGRSGGGRSAGRTSAGRRTGSGARTGGSARKGRAGGSIPRLAGHGRSRSSWGAGTSRHNARRPAGHGKQTAGSTGGQARRSPINRHHSRIQWRDHRREAGIFGLTVGGVLLAPLLAPTALGVVGVLGTGLVYGGLAVGGYWLARNPKVRYGASVIAGWAKLSSTRFGRWARAQWWRLRGKPLKPQRIVVDAELLDEPRAAKHTTAPTPEPMDADIVPDPAKPQPQLRVTPAATELSATRHQPQLTAGPTPPLPAAPIRKQANTMQHVVEAIINSDTFVPTDGPDAQRHVESIGEALQCLAAKVGADIASIGKTLPQFEESLANLAHLGDAIAAVAGQADEQVNAWRESAAWVWQGQG